MAGLSGFPVVIKFNDEGYNVTFSGSVSVLTSIPNTGMVDFSLIQSACLSHSIEKTKDPVSFCENMVSEIYHGRGETVSSVAGMAVIRSQEGMIISAELAASWKNYFHPRGNFSATFKGFTACPCSMKSVRDLLQSEFPEYGSKISSLPGITHNQRVDFTVEMRYDKPLDHIIVQALKTAEFSMGNVLSFSDSQNETDLMIMKVHSNPRLIEDVLKKGVVYSRNLLKNIPELTEMEIRVKSMESIHPYDAVASATISR